MSQIICPKCGEKTIDRLTNCPVCNEPLAEGKEWYESRRRRLYYTGGLFVGGILLATIFNVIGMQKVAIVFAAIGVISLVALILKMNATN